MQNDFRISGQQFREIHAADVASRRARWIVPELLPLERRVAEENCLWIFSVNPWGTTSLLGSWGRKFVPPCGKDQPWVRMSEPIPGVFSEPLPGADGARTMTLLRHEGAQMAQEILQRGRGHLPANDLTRQGFWVGSVTGPKGAEPLPAEVAAARSALREFYGELVREAQSAYNVSAAECQATVSDHHRYAATELNMPNVPWMAQFKTEGNRRCEVCGHVAAGDTIICSNCRFIFDPIRYKQIQSRMAGEAK
jgi:hypothetical protein